MRPIAQRRFHCFLPMTGRAYRMLTAGRAHPRVIISCGRVGFKGWIGHRCVRRDLTVILSAGLVTEDALRSLASMISISNWRPLAALMRCGVWPNRRRLWPIEAFTRGI